MFFTNFSFFFFFFEKLFQKETKNVPIIIIFAPSSHAFNPRFVKSVIAWRDLCDSQRRDLTVRLIYTTILERREGGEGRGWIHGVTSFLLVSRGDEKYRYNERPIGFLRFLRGVSCPFLAATLEYRINAHRLIARKRQDLSFSISLYSSVSKWTTSGQGRGGGEEEGGRGRGGGKKILFRLLKIVSKRSRRCGMEESVHHRPTRFLLMLIPSFYFYSIWITYFLILEWKSR